MTDRDWRLFAQVRERARERFAAETLRRAAAVCQDEGRSTVRREGALEVLLAERGHERAALFEDFRRSTARLRLALMVTRGLVSSEELAPFSLEIRRQIGIGEVSDGQPA